MKISDYNSSDFIISDIPHCEVQIDIFISVTIEIMMDLYKLKTKV